MKGSSEWWRVVPFIHYYPSSFTIIHFIIHYYTSSFTTTLHHSLLTSSFTTTLHHSLLPFTIDYHRSLFTIAFIIHYYHSPLFCNNFISYYCVDSNHWTTFRKLKKCILKNILYMRLEWHTVCTKLSQVVGRFVSSWKWHQLQFTETS